ncbi:MAG: sulfotransferase [Actinomycetota bacterium]
MTAASLPGETSPAPPTVLYIAGSGRSGSTLLERILAGIPGAVSVGELLDLPRRIAPHDERCGCAKPFSQCAFWNSVGERAFGGWDPDLLSDLHHRQVAVARQRHLPRLMLSRRTSAFGEQMTGYTQQYQAILSAVATQAQARYVIDASKWPALALALHRGGVNLRVIHLIRDPRGVAYSLSRKNIARPHSIAGTDMMFSKHPVIGTSSWLTTQMETDLIRLRGVPVTRLSYEHLVTDPRSAIDQALTSLDIRLPSDGLNHVQGTTVTLGPGHGLSGNPSRFKNGDVPLRSDERWRRDMRAIDRLASSVIASPYLLFRGRHRPKHSQRPTDTRTNLTIPTGPTNDR